MKRVYTLIYRNRLTGHMSKINYVTDKQDPGGVNIRRQAAQYNADMPYEESAEYEYVVLTTEEW